MIGASPLGVYKAGGGISKSIGVAGVGTYYKLGFPKVRIGDECECHGGELPNGPLGTALEVLEELQL